MELGLSTNEEVGHLGHMVCKEEWRGLTGDQDTIGDTDARISRVVSQMLRRGTCYQKRCMSALGYMSLFDKVAIARSSRARHQRIGMCGARVG